MLLLALPTLGYLREFHPFARKPEPFIFIPVADRPLGLAKAFFGIVQEFVCIRLSHGAEITRKGELRTSALAPVLPSPANPDSPT